MKILHISKGWFDTVVYINLYNHLKEYMDQYVYAIVSTRRKVVSNDNNISILKCLNTKLRGLYTVKIIIIFRYILKYQDNIDKFDLIHAHFVYFDGDIAYRLFKKFNIPYIVTVRSSDIYIYDKRFYLRSIGYKILSSASKIVFISYSHKKYFFKRYLASSKLKDSYLLKSVVIPNGIDDFWLKNIQPPINKNFKKEINLLTVAGLDSNKNHKLVVNAIRELKIRGYTCNYKIIGKIIDKKVYNDLIKYSFVEYLKPMKKDKLIHHYRSADIFVMPSHSETFGLVYIEALTQGLPVIYTENQGIDGFFKEGEVGFSVNSKNIIDLTETILKTIKNYNKFNFNSIDFNNFNWEIIAKKYKNINTEILS